MADTPNVGHHYKPLRKSELETPNNTYEDVGITDESTPNVGQHATKTINKELEIPDGFGYDNIEGGTGAPPNVGQHASKDAIGESVPPDRFKYDTLDATNLAASTNVGQHSGDSVLEALRDASSYADLSKEWAISPELVEDLDYSSKHWALLAKDLIEGGDGFGQPNTASNIGLGEGVFANKFNFDLQFKSIGGGTGVIITSDPSNVIIDIDSALLLNLDADYAWTGEHTINSGEVWHDAVNFRTAASAKDIVDKADYGNIGDYSNTPSTANLDTFDKSGFFYVEASAPNNPGNARGIVLVAAGDSSNTGQLFLQTGHGTNESIVYQRSTNNGSTWTNWSKIINTGGAGGDLTADLVQFDDTPEDVYQTVQTALAAALDASGTRYIGNTPNAFGSQDLPAIFASPLNADNVQDAIDQLYGIVEVLTTGLTFVGTWNAEQNIPDLQAINALDGEYYLVTVPGNTDLTGAEPPPNGELLNDFDEGDQVLWDGVAGGNGYIGWLKFPDDGTGNIAHNIVFDSNVYSSFFSAAGFPIPPTNVQLAVDIIWPFIDKVYFTGLGRSNLKDTSNLDADLLLETGVNKYSTSWGASVPEGIGLLTNLGMTTSDNGVGTQLFTALSLDQLFWRSKLSGVFGDWKGLFSTAIYTNAEVDQILIDADRSNAGKIALVEYGGDLRDMKETGFLTTATSATNTPNPGTKGTIVQVHESDNFSTQMYHEPSSNNLYIRGKTSLFTSWNNMFGSEDRTSDNANELLDNVIASNVGISTLVPISGSLDDIKLGGFQRVPAGLNTPEAAEGSLLTISIAESISTTQLFHDILANSLSIRTLSAGTYGNWATLFSSEDFNAEELRIILSDADDGNIGKVILPVDNPITNMNGVEYTGFHSILPSTLNTPTLDEPGALFHLNKDSVNEAQLFLEDLTNNFFVRNTVSGSVAPWNNIFGSQIRTNSSANVVINNADIGNIGKKNVVPSAENADSYVESGFYHILGDVGAGTPNDAGGLLIVTSGQDAGGEQYVTQIFNDTDDLNIYSKTFIRTKNPLGTPTGLNGWNQWEGQVTTVNLSSEAASSIIRFVDRIGVLPAYDNVQEGLAAALEAITTRFDPASVSINDTNVQGAIEAIFESIELLVSGLVFKGTWNADRGLETTPGVWEYPYGTPDMSVVAKGVGFFWVVSTAGIAPLADLGDDPLGDPAGDPLNDWGVNDRVVWDDSPGSNAYVGFHRFPSQGEVVLASSVLFDPLNYEANFTIWTEEYVYEGSSAIAPISGAWNKSADSLILRISATDNLGGDQTELLSLVSPSTSFSFLQTDNAGKFVRFETTGAGTDFTTYWAYPVIITNVSGGGPTATAITTANFFPGTAPDNAQGALDKVWPFSRKVLNSRVGLDDQQVITKSSNDSRPASFTAYNGSITTDLPPGNTEDLGAITTLSDNALNFATIALTNTGVDTRMYIKHTDELNGPSPWKEAYFSDQFTAGQIDYILANSDAGNSGKSSGLLPYPFTGTPPTYDILNPAVPNGFYSISGATVGLPIAGVSEYAAIVTRYDQDDTTIVLYGQGLNSGFTSFNTYDSVAALWSGWSTVPSTGANNVWTGSNEWTGITNDTDYMKSVIGHTLLGQWAGRPYLGDSQNNYDTVLATNSTHKIQYDQEGTLYDIWHEGNMGADSGLNADKVDGYHAIDLLPVMDEEFTVVGVEQGEYSHGDVIPKDTTLVSIIKKMLTFIIPPTYEVPTLSLAGSGTKLVETGTVISPNLTPTFLQKDGGASTNYELEKTAILIFNNITPVQHTDPNVLMLDGNLEYQAFVDYAQGPIKENNAGIPDPIGQVPVGSTESALVTYTGARKAFYGFNGSITDIRSLSNSYLNAKNGTSFSSIGTGTNYVVSYPASLRALTQVIFTSSGFAFDITGEMVREADVMVNDLAGGNPILYEVYQYAPVSSFTDATIKITI